MGETLLITSITPEELSDRLQQNTPQLPFLEPLIPAYVALLRLEQETKVAPLPLELTPSEAHALLEREVPLLQRDVLLALPEAMADAWRQVCDITIRYLEDKAEALRTAQQWPQKGPEEWLAAMRQYFRDGELKMDDAAEKEVLTFLTVRTWRPFLRGWASRLSPLLDDSRWGRGTCPICGGQPDFAYLTQETGERRLLCSRCDTEWHFDRIGCPFCGNQDSSTYGYYTNEDSPYRLYACNQCRRYLKTLDMRQTMGKRFLAVERIVTMGMDLSALQAGYRSV